MPSVAIVTLLLFQLLAYHCQCAELSYSYPNAFNPQPAALIKVKIHGSIGSEVITTVDRDNLPLSTIDAQLHGFRSAPYGYWPEKIRQQLKLANYRLTNRYLLSASAGQLPLPPHTVWNITVLPTTGRLRIGRSKKLFVVFDYEVTSMIVARRGSIESAEVSLLFLFRRSNISVSGFSPDVCLCRRRWSMLEVCILKFAFYLWILHFCFRYIFSIISRCFW